MSTVDIQIKGSVLRVSNSKVFSSIQPTRANKVLLYELEVNCEDPEVGFKKIGGRLETDPEM